MNKEQQREERCPLGLIPYKQTVRSLDKTILDRIHLRNERRNISPQRALA